MSGLKKCCRKCFPQGCCGFCKPPPQLQQQTDKIIHLQKDVQEKVLPYGYINFYPGVRTSDNKYTSPMLCAHLYWQSEFKADSAQDKRLLVVNDDDQQTHQGPRELRKEEKASAKEEIIMIPVEDVTQIGSKSEVKKGAQADIKLENEPVYKLSENCCDRCASSLCNCCTKLCFCCREETKVAPEKNSTIVAYQDPNQSENYEEEHIPAPKEKEGCCTGIINSLRCWCCRRNILVKHIRKTRTKTEQRAQRVVTITLEYSKYSNLDSASNARLLSEEHQLKYYKEKFQPDTKIEFYLINDTEYDKDNFNRKRQQAETLCRTIMQLKAMRNFYPSENELTNMLDQLQNRTFGDEFKEPTLQLMSNLTPKPINPSPVQPLPQPNRKQNMQEPQIIPSKPHEEPEKHDEQNNEIHDDDF